MTDLIEELEKAAALCDRLQFTEDSAGLATTLLEPLSSYLGADMGVFRVFSAKEGRTRLADVITLGVPDHVTDAYLTRYAKMDPILRELQKRLAGLLFANDSQPGCWVKNQAPPAEPSGVNSMPRYREDFLQYRKEFLLPNRLLHHLGFYFHDPCCRRTFLFNFHRTSESSPFGRCEHARMKIIATFLRAKSHQLRKCYEDRQHHGTPDGLDFREQLSPRERAVAEAVALGNSNKEIAIAMMISVSTVENHLRSIFYKLGVSSRTRLAAKLYEAREVPHRLLDDR
jgi:DNA-binding CsgD family transcriptional regulator